MKIVLGLGSNLGDRKNIILHAYELLEEKLGKKLQDNNVSKEIRDMFATLFSFYTRYNNQNVKHDDKCVGIETEYIIYLTGTFIRFLIQIKYLLYQLLNFLCIFHSY